jgi:hypothetical protein
MSDAALRNTDEIDLSLLLDPDVLLRQLQVRFAPQLAERDKYIEAFERFKAATEKGITDDEQLGRAAEFERKQLKGLADSVETAHTEVKRPVNEAATTIQGFYNREFRDPLAAMIKEVKTRREKYMKDKAEVDRKRAEELAKIEREKAEALAKKAEQTNKPKDWAKAVDAEQAAADAARVAETTPIAERARVTGDFGVTSSLRETWHFEVTDITKVPGEYLLPNEKVIRAAISGKSGKRSIPGLRIFPKQAAI